MKLPRSIGAFALAGLLAAAVILCVQDAAGADWPTWRYDAQRTAASPEVLPAELHLQWVRELPAPRPAWPPQEDDRDKLQFDLSYEPVVAGKTLFVPSMLSDHVAAYDANTGKEKWRFYADGPVRFAPVAWQDKVYFVSDDGYLYCVNSGSGVLLWKFRGGPSDKKVLGNERLMSAWPARGGPVIFDGKAYFAASIWPFMGTFIHALDAETGKVIWTNSGSGSIYVPQQHDSPAFAGVAPQGYMAATEDTLLVAGGRTVPAGYDRKAGKFLYFNVADSAFGRDAGGYAVCVAKEWFLNRGRMYRINDGAGVIQTPASVVSDEAIFSIANNGTLVASALRLEHEEYVDRKGKKQTRALVPKLWEAQLKPALDRIFIKAGPRLYGGGANGLIAAVDLPQAGRQAKVSWQTRIKGDAWNMLAADGKLFVVTRQGRIYCFGTEPGRETTYELSPVSGRSNKPADKWTAAAREIIETTGAAEGYCLVLGLESGRLIEELVSGSKLRVIALDPDADKVAGLRRKLDDAGLYGVRVSVHVGDVFSVPLPPYLASLIVSEDLSAAGFDKGGAFVKGIFRALRPYGGVACLALPSGGAGDGFANLVKDADLAGAEVSSAGQWTLMKRAGALPGSADWTHQYADSANSVVSKDASVKAPLGLLWFGGPSNATILPRHGHGPSPQVVEGRLFIQGRDLIRAADVYTGRLLWEREFKDIGKFYDETNHQPGANEIGSNYVSRPEGVYVMGPRFCLRLDPATGRTMRTYLLPQPNDQEPPRWGFIAVWNDLLVATVSPMSVPTKDEKADGNDSRAGRPAGPQPGHAKQRNGQENPELELKSIPGVALDADYASASRTLVVMDTGSGKMLWSRPARHGFRHNAIVVAASKVFCIDGMSEQKLAYLRRRGYEIPDKPTLYALDAYTGKEVWSTTRNIFGTWLAYSQEHDVLVQATSKERDRAEDEAGRGMAAYRGADGGVLWSSDLEYGGPVMLHHDTIITQGGALSLTTGEEKVRPHPLTGTMVPWRFARNYGCNTAIASEHLLTFRSAAAGYYDLSGDGGTGNLGGFKSGCTSNLIAADGVLNAPDYTRTCTCSYQNQTSLALVHDPQVEVWTFSAVKPDEQPVRRVGINFGAPGDRLADDGTLWLDYPSVGGPSPDIPIKTVPEDPEWFRYHCSRMSGEGPNWVTASGAKGVTTVTVTLAKEGSTTRPYTVRLYFAEPEDKAPGQRVFDVGVAGRQVLKGFDIAAQAGSTNRGVVRAFEGISIADELTITLTPSPGNQDVEPIICGIEIAAEGW